MRGAARRCGTRRRLRDDHAEAHADSGIGCVFRLAADALPSATLSASQRKVLAVLTDVFSADGATKSEWQRTCEEVPERSFHRAATVLQERGLVKQTDSHFRVTAGAR